MRYFIFIYKTLDGSKITICITIDIHASISFVIKIILRLFMCDVLYKYWNNKKNVFLT